MLVPQQRSRLDSMDFSSGELTLALANLAQVGLCFEMIQALSGFDTSIVRVSELSITAQQKPSGVHG